MRKNEKNYIGLMEIFDHLVLLVVVLQVHLKNIQNHIVVFQDIVLIRDSILDLHLVHDDHHLVVEEDEVEVDEVVGSI
jgi:hypothetical protein